jgi:DNA-binding GntR family transcriptional regulator
LVHRTGRVYSVAPIDLEELEEAFQFRELLETSAVRLAATRKPKAKEIKNLLASLETKLDPEVELEKATGFHLALAKLSGNRFIVSSLASVLARIYRARYVEIVSPQGAEQARADHLQLIELVQAGQGDEAAAFIYKHLQRSRDRLESSLEGNDWGKILLSSR